MEVTVPQKVGQVLRMVFEAGFEIYIVGGAVRDLLLGRPILDWDFTTNATPEEILRIFPEGFYDNKFGTVGISFEEEMRPYEITTFRTEAEYTDSRRPISVEWGKSLNEDLIRRDFTINAMALEPKLQISSPEKLASNGQTIVFSVVDLFEGRRDIEKKLIRAVGNPNERFAEDALRMMRAIRIASELGFAIETDTFAAICANSQTIANISGERIREELFKILKTEYVYDGLVLLRNSGILGIILPEVVAGFGVEQASPGRHHVYDVGMHSFLATKFCSSNDPLVRLATLLHDCGKPMTYKKLPSGTITFYNHEVTGAAIVYKIANRLRLSKEQTKRLVTLVRWHQFSVDDRQTDSAIRRFMRRVGKENIADMLALRTGDRLGGGAKETSWRLEKYKERIEQLSVTPFTISDLAIDGNDIMKLLQVAPGPVVGKILSVLFEEVMEDPSLNDPTYLAKRAGELKNNVN